MSKNGSWVLFLAGSTLLVKVEQASKGSATYNVPHMPDSLADGADIKHLVQITTASKKQHMLKENKTPRLIFQ